MDLIIFPSVVGVLFGVQWISMPRKLSMAEVILIGTIVSTTISMVIG